MPGPSERAEALTGTATDGEGLSKEVRARIAHVMDRALEEGRRAALQEAKEACRYGIADPEAKAQGFRSWDAENCVSAIGALEAQDG